MARSTDPHNSTFQQIDLRDVADRLLGQGRKRGKAVLYHSPLRPGDDHPSFAVYRDGFKDFGGSGETGGHLAFVQAVLGSDRAAALEWLNQFTGGLIAAPLRTRTQPPTAENEPPPKEWQDAAFTAIEIARDYLWSSHPDAKKALAYLRDVRGLSNHTIMRFHLGYNPAWKKLSYRSPDTGKPISLPPGITIPYIDNGTIWAVRVRSRVGNLAQALGLKTDDTHFTSEPLPKYLGLAGGRGSGVLFNGASLAAGHDVLIVEGEFDAMLAAQLLEPEGVNAVTLGSASSRLSKRGRDALSQARSIWLALDNDASGRAAAAKLRDALPEAQLRTLDAAKDITEFVVDQGGDLRAWWVERHTASLPLHHFAEGVPDSWRSALLRLEPSAAPIYELITEGSRTREIHDYAFSAGDLMKLSSKRGWNLGKNPIYTGLQKLVDLGFITQMRTDSEDDQSILIDRKNPQGGRSATFYACVPLEVQREKLIYLSLPRIRQSAYPIKPREGQPAVLAPITSRSLSTIVTVQPQIVEMVEASREEAYARQPEARRKAAWRENRRKEELIADLANPHSTPFPAEWSCGNLREYRIAFLRTVKLIRGQELASNRQLREFLGISTNVVNDYLAAAGFLIEGNQTAVQALEASKSIEKQITQIAREVQGRPSRFVAVDEQSKAREVFAYDQEGKTRAAALIHEGYQVEIICNTANKHVLIPNFEPPSKAEAIPVRKRPAKRVAMEQSECLSKPMDDAPSSSREDEVDADDAEGDSTTGYSREWVIGQLLLAFEVLGWKDPQGRYFNGETGEILPPNPTPRQIIECFIGELLPDHDRLLDAIRASGGVRRSRLLV